MSNFALLNKLPVAAPKIEIKEESPLKSIFIHESMEKKTELEKVIRSSRSIFSIILAIPLWPDTTKDGHFAFVHHIVRFVKLGK